MNVAFFFMYHTPALPLEFKPHILTLFTKIYPSNYVAQHPIDKLRVPFGKPMMIIFQPYKHHIVSNPKLVGIKLEFFYMTDNIDVNRQSTV